MTSIIVIGFILILVGILVILFYIGGKTTKKLRDKLVLDTKETFDSLFDTKKIELVGSQGFKVKGTLKKGKIGEAIEIGFILKSRKRLFSLFFKRHFEKMDLLYFYVDPSPPITQPFEVITKRFSTIIKKFQEEHPYYKEFHVNGLESNFYFFARNPRKAKLLLSNKLLLYHLRAKSEKINRISVENKKPNLVIYMNFNHKYINLDIYWGISLANILFSQ